MRKKKSAIKKKVIVVTAVVVSAVVLLCIFTDFDGDGLSNVTELRLGTSAFNSDTDSDGLNDGLEVNTYKTSPLAADTDGDNLTDWTEIYVHKTNPLSTDTDGDTLTDGAEIITYMTNPLAADTDNDNLDDGTEVNGWSITISGQTRRVSSNPLLQDSDEDNLTDWAEHGYNTDPRENDTDEDNLSDGLEINGWAISVNYQPENVTSNPLLTDSDGDNSTDWEEFYAHHTNPSNSDTDNDGLSDKFETIPWLISVNSQAQYVTSTPYLKDSDKDGLDDWNEYNFFTNPSDSDTDFDGVPDKLEIDRGSDPTIYEGTKVEMLIFVSPQYADDRRMKQAIVEYITAVNADIGWKVRIIGLTPTTNTVGEIRKIVREFYLSDGTFVSLMVGDDIANARNNIPITVFWSELNETIVVSNAAYKEIPRQEISVGPECIGGELDSLLQLIKISNSAEEVWIDPTHPDMCISLLRPTPNPQTTKENTYEIKVDRIINAFKKFSVRGDYYGENILFLADVSIAEDCGIYEVEREVRDSDIYDVVSWSLTQEFLDEWHSLGEARQTWDFKEDGPLAELVTLYFQETQNKLLGICGHGNPWRAHVISTYKTEALGILASIEETRVPVLMVSGCGVQCWSENREKWWGELTLLHPDIKVVIAGMPFTKDQRSCVTFAEDETLVTYTTRLDHPFAAYPHKGFAWYAGGSLGEGKTIAEAWLAYPYPVQSDAQVIYGDPTFHY